MNPFQGGGRGRGYGRTMYSGAQRIIPGPLEIVVPLSQALTTKCDITTPAGKATKDFIKGLTVDEHSCARIWSWNSQSWTCACTRLRRH